MIYVVNNTRYECDRVTLLWKQFLLKLSLIELFFRKIIEQRPATFIKNIRDWSCVKSVCIRSYPGLYFRAFGLNTERYGVSLCIQSDCAKIRTKIAPNTETPISFSETCNVNIKFVSFPETIYLSQVNNKQNRTLSLTPFCCLSF